MTKFFAIGDWTIRNFPNDFMNGRMFAIAIHSCITILIVQTTPIPATIIANSYAARNTLWDI